jgi:hypothetical protein
MQTKSTSLFNQMSRSETDRLTTQVKETLALDHNTSSKTFSAAELWNIQRQHKTITQRRRFVY